ncbi:winged helix-turn-helix domain-containing protein [Streptomyces chrestomyceticus]|uniref:winged helix-turn-helix domain-containing protein n=1 Tax=Streptomyces chrestomyceticus TaxID=68185 RepID=UPI0033D7C164
MTDEESPAVSTGPSSHRAARSLPDHPVRIALLDLLAEAGTVTSTQAAARLGHSSGLCSFHLRQLARHGLIEEVPHTGGRARPWRLRWDSAAVRPETESGPDAPSGPAAPSGPYAPAEGDVAYRTVVHVTPAELAGLAAAIRALLTPYAERERQPGTRPAGTMPVTAVTRLTPLPPEDVLPGNATRHRKVGPSTD